LCLSRGLTFELSRHQREAAGPGLWRMYPATDRARRLAVGARLERGVRPHRVSAKEATVVVLVNNSQRVLQILMNWRRLIEMPLQVSSHPVKAPFILGPDVLDTSNRRMTSSCLVLPVRPDLKEVDFVTDYRVPEVKLFSKVLWRLMPRHEPLQGSVVRCALSIIECHAADGTGPPSDHSRTATRMLGCAA